MNELHRHIETLLLENDCLTVPGLGGFVAHYIPAKYNVDSFSFEPPTRIIGFNQQLKMNDGLLVQSYMALYGLSYADAYRLVEQEVEQLKEKLYIEGEIEIENIGTLSYDINGHYDFVPLDNLLTTPSLYALGSFEIQPLADAPVNTLLGTERKEAEEPHTAILKPLAEKTEKVIEHAVAKHISMWPSYLSGAVATVALIIISFMFSTPLKNTYMDAEGMEAGIITGQSLEDFKKHSLALNTIKIRQIADLNHFQHESQGTSGSSTNRPDNNAKETRTLTSENKTNKEETDSTTKTDSKSLITGNEFKSQNKKDAEVPNVASTKNAQHISVSQAREIQKFKTETPAKRRYHLIIASVGSPKDAQDMVSSLKAQGNHDASAIIGEGRNRVALDSFEKESDAYKALNVISESGHYKGAWVLKK